MFWVAQAVLAAVVAAAGTFEIPNASPHAIRDANDAIATAWIEWKQQFPDRDIESALVWETECSARLHGKVWTVKKRSSAPDDPRGITIYLDAGDGHIISAKVVD
jgi:hypothetical protein